VPLFFTVVTNLRTNQLSEEIRVKLKNHPELYFSYFVKKKTKGSFFSGFYSQIKRIFTLK